MRGVVAGLLDRHPPHAEVGIVRVGIFRVRARGVLVRNTAPPGMVVGFCGEEDGFDIPVLVAVGVVHRVGEQHLAAALTPCGVCVGHYSDAFFVVVPAGTPYLVTSLPAHVGSPC